MSDVELFSFEGWDGVEDIVRKYAGSDEVSYAGLMLLERNEERKSETEQRIDKYDFSDPNELSAVQHELAMRDRTAAMSGIEAPDDDDVEEVEEDVDDEADAGNPPEDDPEDSDEKRETAERNRMLAERCLRSFRLACERQMSGARNVRFRVRIYATKGQTTFKMATFLVRSNAIEDEAPPQRRMQATMILPRAPAIMGPNGEAPPDNPAPGARVVVAPEYDDRIAMASLTAWEGLGRQYRNYGDFVVRMHENMMTASMRQLDKALLANESLAAMNDRLQAALITDRASRDQGESKANEQVTSQERAKLAQKALDSITDLGGAIIAHKAGISPEMAGILQKIGASPKLKAKFAEPAVVEMLSDPAALDELAGVLDYGVATRAAAKAALEAQKKAAEAASNPSQEK